MCAGPVIHVRRLAWEKADIDQILEIENSSFNRFDAYSLADFERWFHYNPDLCIVAEVDGRIAVTLISRILPGIGDLASLAIGPRSGGAGSEGFARGNRAGGIKDMACTKLTRGSNNQLAGLASGRKWALYHLERCPVSMKTGRMPFA